MKEFSFLLYTVDDSDIKVNDIVKDETIWLSQKGMAELFDVEVPAISKHLTNIYAEGDLSEDATVSKMEIVQQEGKRQVEYYSLDAIFSVGYRVNSKRATHFRFWNGLFQRTVGTDSLYSCERTQNLAADYRYFCRM